MSLVVIPYLFLLKTGKIGLNSIGIRKFELIDYHSGIITDYEGKIISKNSEHSLEIMYVSKNN